MADYSIDPSHVNELGIDQLGTGLEKQDVKDLAGYGARYVAKIPAIPTGMYGLGSDLLKAASHATMAQDDDSPFMSMAKAVINRVMPMPAAIGETGVLDNGLPGAETAHAVTDAIDKNALDIGSSVADRTLQPGIFGQGHTVGDRIGTALDIAGSIIPITGGPIKAGFEALKTINTGIKVIDKSVPVAVEAAAYLSPLVPTDHAVPLVAGSVALGTAAEAARTAMAPDAPLDIDQEILKFQQQTDQVHAQLNSDTQAHTDAQVNAVGQIADTTKVLDLQHEIEQFHATVAAAPNDPIAHEVAKQKVVQAGYFDPSDYGRVATGLAGLTLLAGGAYLHRDVIRAKSLEFFGGKEFGKAAKEDFISKPNNTDLSVPKVIAAESQNSAIPLMEHSADPEMMQARTEKIASAWNVHSTSLHNDGSFANSNIKTVPLDDFVAAARELAADPAKLKLARDAANAQTEMGNRVRSWIEGEKPVGLGTRNVDDPVVLNEYSNWLAQQKQGIPSGPAAQHLTNAVESKYAFHTLDPATNTVASFGDLLQSRRAAMADPDVAGLLTDFKDITRKSLDYVLEQGVITKKEHADLVRQHPNYFPTRIKGQHMSALELSEKGGRLSQGDPFKELFPYLEQTVKNVAHEQLKTAFMLEQIALKRSGSNRAGMLIGREDIVGKNAHNEDKVVQWRDAMGNPKITEVTDPMVRLALQPGAGSATLRLNQGILKFLSIPSRILESATTGPLAAIVGSPFAIANATYGSVATLINRPKGTVAGLLDRIVQDASGGRIGVRGDPTFHAQVAAQILPNVIAVLAKSAGNALENVVKSKSWYAPAVSGGTLDTVSKALSNHYKASMLHDLEVRGLHGGATPMVRNTTPTLKDLEGALLPSVKVSSGWIATRDFMHDLLGAVGNAPQAAFLKQNKGRMSEDLLTTRTRNVMGDPSKSGLASNNVGKSVVGAVIASPWGSVTLQSMARFSKAVGENPLGTTMAITNTVAVPAILVSLWNMKQGKEYVDYQHNKRTPDQVSGSIYVAIPGHPPNEGLEIRVDQLMRPFKVLADMLFAHAYGVMDGSIFKPENEKMRMALEDGMATRYGTTGDAMTSALNAALPAIPPALNIAAGAMGFNQIGRSYLDNPTKITDNKNAGATDSTSRIIDNKWFGYDVSARTEATMQAIGGQVAQGIYETLTSVHQGKKDGLTPGDNWKDWQDRFGMRIGQANREVSGIWGHAATIAPSQDASNKALQPQMEGLRKLEAASLKLRTLSGSGDELTGAKGREISALVGSGPVQFKDQQMYALAFDAQKFVQMYDKMYSGTLKDLYAQRGSIQSSEKVPPKEKQTLMNDNAGQIAKVTGQGLQALEQWKWRVSKTYNRDIDLKKIQLDEPITQFKSLLPQ